MLYVSGIGYDVRTDPSPYLGDRELFFGEAAFYFFLCKPCRETLVLPQWA